MTIVWAAVRARMGPPAIFRQQRPGLHGQPFQLYKFRTMMAHAAGQRAGDEYRLTGLGQWLRESSLDELPELVNVLRGDMSLVGPRPLLMEYLELYTPEEARRHAVRPGITGLAQVKGRNALTWEQRFRLDVWYVDHQSVCLDLQIMWLTVRQVLAGHGISAEGHATMPAFQRNDAG
jgi:sugar transferase EpsL